VGGNIKTKKGMSGPSLVFIGGRGVDKVEKKKKGDTKGLWETPRLQKKWNQSVENTTRGGSKKKPGERKPCST